VYIENKCVGQLLTTFDALLDACKLITTEMVCVAKPLPRTILIVDNRLYTYHFDWRTAVADAENAATRTSFCVL